MTVNLIKFLLERIEEDELVARASIEPDALFPWGDRSLPQRKPEDVPADVRGYLGGVWGDHFANWAPLRVLAECEAKRRIVEWYALTAETPEIPAMGWQVMKGVLTALALPYADHPDYDPAWRP